MSFVLVRWLVLLGLTLYQAIACWQEDRQPVPGQKIDVGGYSLHYVVAGSGSPTLVLDHSLGGIEGYFLIEQLAKRSRVVIYDRAGYGWSDRSPRPRTSQHIVDELEALLVAAKIEPPYILLGDSSGSYNTRLYAYCYPHKVVGLILVDGLHETGMLKMSVVLRSLQLFFASGFVMSVLGALLGIIRLLQKIGMFEVLKPGLRQFSHRTRRAVKRSFSRPKHWITMAQEILGLDKSGQQMQRADNLGNLPIVTVKAKSFFLPSFFTLLMPLKAANRLRDRMHDELAKLSTHHTQIKADQSGHFVWIDQPEMIVRAVQELLPREHDS